MSKKTELLAVLKGYKSIFTAADSQIGQVKKSTDYTPEGQKNAVRTITDSFRSPAQQAKEKAISILVSAEDALKAKWGKVTADKLTDSGYQMGLANVVKMLESDVILDKDSFKTIIDTYAGDYNSLALIAKAAEKSSHALEFAFMIPKDNRQRNLKVLHDLKRGFETYMNVNSLVNGTGSFAGVDMAIDGYIDFVQNRFTEDFELLEDSTSAEA